jgi:hypothetical protein
MSLLRRIFHELFGGIPVRFASAYPLETSIERLRSRTRKSPFGGLFQEGVAGRVSEEKVSLRRVIPFFSNGFKPVFKGRFKREANGVVLEGQFTKFFVTKIVMGFSFGFVVLWTLLSCVIALGTALMPDKSLGVSLTIFFPLIGASTLIAGYALVRLGAPWSRNDIAYLSGVITQALGAEQAPSKT